MAKKSKPTPATKAAIPGNDIDLELLLIQTTLTQTNLESLIAARDEQIALIHQEFAANIASCEEAINRDMEILQRWALANEERFGELKSVSIASYRIGWRFGSWGTKLKSKVTWANVLERLKDFISIGRKNGASQIATERAELAATLIRIKEEVNKEAMIAARENPLAITLLDAAGVGFKQEETFYVEPDRKGQSGPTLTA